jgi:hypothetical protein
MRATKTKGRTWLLLLCVLTALAIVVMVTKLASKELINEARFNMIKIGMTQKDVESIFGGPPGDYGRGRIIEGVHFPLLSTRPNNWRVEEWSGSDVKVTLYFSENGRLMRRFIGPLAREKTTINRIIDWLLAR